MSSQLRDTSPAHFSLSSRPVLLTSRAEDRIKSPSEITSSTSSCTTTVFFTLNPEMRWHALQTGRVYVRQHPGDAQLSLDELRDMVGRQGEAFSNRVLHYASSLHGTKQYRQRSRLLSMVDTLGLPTIFFTHSAADLQWPELARLTCPDDPDSRASRTKAVIENPAVADWFFYERVVEFIKAYYVGVLGVTDYWMQFEWQHRGSPHVHGLAWLPNAPDVEQLLSSPDTTDTVKAEITRYADGIVSTCNPAVLPDGSNVDDAPAPKTDPHVCNKVYGEIQDFDTIWLPHVNATRGAQQHTACVHETDDRSVALATPSLYSHTQLLSWKTSQIYSQHETTAWPIASTPCSCLPGVLM